MIRASLFALGTAAVLAFSAAPAHAAATIQWGSAQDITGVSDVQNNGTAFAAITFFNTDLTVNGVTFTHTGGTGNADIAIAGTYDTGAYGAHIPTAAPSSQDYSDLVSTGTFGFFSTGTVTIGGGATGLTVGHVYQVESWSFYSGDGSATTIYNGNNTVTLANSTGQFAVGTFTATEATETYNFSSTSGHNFINSVSVRDITPAVVTPEPASLGVLGLGAVAMLRRRRR